MTKEQFIIEIDNAITELKNEGKTYPKMWTSSVIELMQKVKNKASNLIL